jgi:predicted hydrolase (HD superfamily)
MEKVLFAVDELTGLIGAAALMRPTGISDMEPKSVLKKFKDKKFAAGCSRDIIQKGADLLGMELGELVTKTLEAMKSE